MRKKETATTNFKQLARLGEKMGRLPKLSPVEERVAESEQRFEAVYHSNKLEGNKLTKTEARRAVLSE
ncbi:MAG: hypothetical protein Q8R35_00100 [bacterium]|nr:hypothetical protein [bacterium]